MIGIKTAEEIAKMREAGKILAGILGELENLIRQAEHLEEHLLEEVAQELLSAHGVTSPFQHYQGYKYATCISVDDEVVHGLPDQGRAISPGSLVGIDLGVKTAEGWMVDSAITVPYGEITAEDQRLLDVTREALEIGIGEAVVGHTIGDVASAVQGYVEGQGFSVIRALSGHGIGKSLHEDPEVPNFGRPGAGPRLEAGMTICIEPMVAAGDWQVVSKPGEWPVVTADGSKAAHFEHTVAITSEGPLILTQRL